MHAAPVGDHSAVKSPLVAQYILQQPLVLADVGAAVEVVRTHYRPCASLGHCGLESGQVYLIEGAVGEVYVGVVAAMLLIVEGIVLHAGGHAVALHALNIGHHHSGGQIGILAHILEVAPVERRAQYVHTRPEEHILLAVAGLLAYALAVERGHLGVPGGGEAGQGGESGHRVVGPPGLVPLVPEHLGTHPVGAVGAPQFGDPQPGHTRRTEFRLRMYHAYLLFGGHPAQSIGHRGLYRSRIGGCGRHYGKRHSKQY